MSSTCTTSECGSQDARLKDILASGEWKCLKGTCLEQNDFTKYSYSEAFDHGAKNQIVRNDDQTVVLLAGDIDKVWTDLQKRKGEDIDKKQKNSGFLGMENVDFVNMLGVFGGLGLILYSKDSALRVGGGILAVYCAEKLAECQSCKAAK
jgi:hypothetical protein